MDSRRTSAHQRSSLYRIRSRNRDESSSTSDAVVASRRKSRSPSHTLRNDPFGALNASMTAARISTGNRSSKSTASSSSARLSAHDIDMLSDAGQRVRSNAPTLTLPKSSSRPPTPAATTSNLHSQALKKSDKGKDRQSKSTETAFSGALAAAEFERMKKEIDSLKNSLSEQKKVAKKQAKKIEELRAEAVSSQMTREEQETRLQLLQSKHSRKEELLSTIERSLVCHICLDLLSKPFSLSPCGHTFCLRDLQEWFRKAPPTEDDMDLDTEDPEYIKFRIKHCPACRAVVSGRPLPVFLVRDLVGVLQKAKASGDIGGTALTRRSTSPYVSEDPWEGIFPNDSELEEAEAEDEEEDQGMLGFGVLYSDSDSEMEGQEDESYYYDSSGERVEMEEEGSIDDEEGEDEMESDEDAEEEEFSDEVNQTPYVAPQWEPPLYTSPEGSNVASGWHPLLRRGCSTWLTNTYQIKYSHANGLIAHLNSLDPDDVGIPLYGSLRRMHRLFLGWNIRNEDNLLSEHSGRLFMTQTLENFRTNPHAFVIRERPSGSMDIHLLFRANQVADYDSTDSESWT